MRDVSILTDNGVNLESALEFLGDLSFYDETIESFMEEQKTRIPNIKKYLKDIDMENYAILVHAMKSDAKYLGFTKLAELSYEHEIASKANNVDEVNKKFDELIAEVDRIDELTKKYMA